MGQRAGDKSDSGYCGVETEFSSDMPQLLDFNINGGFDFVVTPLACFLPISKGHHVPTMQVFLMLSGLQLWLRILLRKCEDDDPMDDQTLGGDPIDSWETWNSFRLLNIAANFQLL